MAITRDLALSQFSKNVAVLDVAPDEAGLANPTSYLGTYTAVALGLQADTMEARAAMDFDRCPELGASGASIRLTTVVEGGLTPLLLVALSDSPYLAVRFRSTRTGEMYTGLYLITEARWSSATDSGQEQSVDCALCGDFTDTSHLPVISDAGEGRALVCGSTYAKDLTLLTLDGENYVSVYTDVSIAVRIDSAEAKAALDTVKYPVPMSREVTINASKVVQAPLAVPQAGPSALPFVEMARARDPITVAITTAEGGTAFTGTGIVDDASLDVSTDSPQKESIQIKLKGGLAGV